MRARRQRWSRFPAEVKAQAIAVRAALEQSGLDHGPISVHEKMHSLKVEPVPSVASLARIFRDAQVARLEPKKKPRASYRRFVYPAPNACWQLVWGGQVVPVRDFHVARVSSGKSRLENSPQC
jgi:hypothetical protein